MTEASGQTILVAMQELAPDQPGAISISSTTRPLGAASGEHVV